LERAEEADLFLVVVDATAERSPALPESLHAMIRQKKAIVVMNKSDLCPQPPPPLPSTDTPVVVVSALTGEGVERLKATIADTAETFRHDPTNLIAISARHAEALRQASECLNSAIRRLGDGGPIELVASDLRGVMAAFGEITGRIDNERMLDALFSTFCIGK
jgi:tRNA modification GTPase